MAVVILGGLVTSTLLLFCVHASAGEVDGGPPGELDGGTPKEAMLPAGSAELTLVDAGVSRFAGHRVGVFHLFLIDDNGIDHR